MKALLALLPLALLAAPVYADCSYPPPPDKLPDGSSATLQQMVEGQKAVKEYDTAVNAYLNCLKLEHDRALTTAGEKPTPEQKKALDEMDRVEVQKHNAAVDQDQAIADRFNEQVKIFKAKNGKSKG